MAENLASKKVCSLWAYSKELDLRSIGGGVVLKNSMWAARSKFPCSESQSGLEEAEFDDTNNLYLESIQASGNQMSQSSSSTYNYCVQANTTIKLVG